MAELSFCFFKKIHLLFFNDMGNLFTSVDKSIEGLLSNDPSLTSLDLSSESIDDEVIIRLVTALNTNTTLTTLDLSQNEIADEGVGSVATILSTNTTLTTIILSQNNFTD